MLKLILIWGLGLISLAVVMGLCVIIFEHVQHRKKQHHYDDLHSRMGLGTGTPSNQDEDTNDS